MTPKTSEGLLSSVSEFCGQWCTLQCPVELCFVLARINHSVIFSVLNCLYDTVSIMLRKNVEKRQMMKQLDGIFLAVDEICDRGIMANCWFVVN